MPDPPLPKRCPAPLSSLDERKLPAGSGYSELHCRTNFSFLEGASHPDELVRRAAELGYQALAITDRNSLAGIVRAHTAAKEVGLKLLVGAEVVFEDAWPAVLLATDRAAYGRLTRLLSLGRRRAPKGECQLKFDDLATHHAGLLAGVIPRSHSAGSAFPSAAVASLGLYRELFQDRCYVLAELHLGSHDRRYLERLAALAQQTAVRLVAANDVHYHQPDRRFLQDVLTAIRQRCTIAELGRRMFPNAERCLKSPGQMTELFGTYPEAVRATGEVAERCTFSLDELRYEYPEELGPPGVAPREYLQQLAWKGARRRYPQGIPEKVRQLLQHELQLIEDLQYEAYFLTVWDLVRFARQRGILCQGRGSAANSVVCYCLGVTSVDPEQIDVLFERFISKERHEAPDIDVDFEHERREEVIQYVYEKYGRDRAGMAAAVITYRSRSAVRDVGKALGFSLDRLNAVARVLGRDGLENLPSRLQEVGLDPDAAVVRQWIQLAHQILDFPRHLSQHVGGLVITRGPLRELVPIENASMPGRTVIEWDKDDLDALGILKVDCLALGMLTAIRKGFSLLAEHYDRSLTLATVPNQEPESGPVYRMIQQADTIGVFQIESRAQMSMLPRLRPHCYYDLVIEVAIVRPGPIQGNMVHPYLRRRSGQEQPDYPNAAVQAVLEKTLGVPIFQEQAMRLAVVAAGFTPGEADQLRRAMGAWRRPGLIDSFRQKLISGLLTNGYSMEFAERLFNQIRGFGEYGFPESHAASFALLVYVSAWMKCYYPAVFTAALLNSQPMGFYAPAQLVADARKHGIEVRPVDVNFSQWDCTLEPVLGNDAAGQVAAAPGPPRALRLGFRMIRGLAQEHGETLVARRGQIPFQSFEELARRTQLSSAVLKHLARADAFQSLDLNRRAALWHALPDQRQAPLWQAAEFPEPRAPLPSMSPCEEVVADYRTSGLSLRGHPFQFLRPRVESLELVPAEQLGTLPPGRRYRVAGLVLLRQRPGTAKGITFVTLEDETGPVNLIVRPEVWLRCRRAAETATIMLVQGRLQRQNEVIHILAEKIEDLSLYLDPLPSAARNFR